MNQNFHFPEENPDEAKIDGLFVSADNWLEELSVLIGLQAPELPENWEQDMVEPTPLELAIMDANATYLLESLNED